MQGVPSNAKSACRVPKVGSKVPQTAGSKNGYLAWRNPFLYFRSLTSGSACRDDEVGLGHLKTDLKSASTTPVARLHHPGDVLGRKRGAVQAARDTGARRRQSAS